MKSFILHKVMLFNQTTQVSDLPGPGCSNHCPSDKY